MGLKLRLLLLVLFGLLLTGCASKEFDTAKMKSETTEEKNAESQTEKTSKNTEVQTEKATAKTEVVAESETIEQAKSEFSFEKFDMSVSIPESYIETSQESTVEDATLYYACNGAVIAIYISAYDNSIDSIGEVMIDAVLSGFKKDSTYTEVEKNDILVDGKTSHATVFLHQGNTCMIVSVDTGKSIVNFVYQSPLTDEEGLSTFSEMVDGTKFIN